MMAMSIHCCGYRAERGNKKIVYKIVQEKVAQVAQRKGCAMTNEAENL